MRKTIPIKLFGHIWDKREDTLKIQVPPTIEQTPVTKRHILKDISSVYDPSGMSSPTIVEGKRIYREACYEKIGSVKHNSVRSVKHNSERLGKVATTVKKCEDSTKFE